MREGGEARGRRNERAEKQESEVRRRKGEWSERSGSERGKCFWGGRGAHNASLWINTYDAAEKQKVSELIPRVVVGDAWE
ncbi:hypothetical protein E2C01_035766 [Portunus trituberculatus]|uniref:Uncharacterized protein n=1 Tax=Portunus trituberculatus TaxID=210409 RepID=A0A5B7FAL9_PORTR|nr:hypothetical protein [Portunus trituberculatus]